MSNTIDELKVGYMKKKSQNKNKLTAENYRRRVFVLTTHCLKYYSGTLDKRKKEKGKISLTNVRVVENIQDGSIEKYINVFQIVYHENNQVYLLYIVADTVTMRSEWTCIVREYCRKNNAKLQPLYHPGIYKSSTGFVCCGDISKKSGCSNSTGQERQEENPHSLLDSQETVTTEENVFQVVAMYDYDAVSPDDLCVVKGEPYDILDSSNENWWYAKAADGLKGYIPSNYVRKILGLDKFSWYFREESRSACEDALKKDGREGAFLVRNSSTRGSYTLSLLSHEKPGGFVRHYHIKKNDNGQYFFSENHAFSSIPEVIKYHMHNAGGLVVRLKHVTGKCNQPITAGLGHDMAIINPSEITLSEELGRGQFGVVRKGKVRGVTVAVKMLHHDKMTECHEFVSEAQTMNQLHHPNLVQLYGVSPQDRDGSIFIVTEFLKNGSLLNYLRKYKTRGLLKKTCNLLEMCAQVSAAMEFLESRRIIHRDLAARNCLVGETHEIKVGDFGLARYVLDDQYTSSLGSKFPVKWAPPEVLNYYKFSSKSDIWSFGVLMWEIFTGGDTPYGNMPTRDVADYINAGHKLERPPNCPHNIYQSFLIDCWHRSAEQRPGFSTLRDRLNDVLEHDYRDYHD